jgi:TonB family protein
MSTGLPERLKPVRLYVMSFLLMVATPVMGRTAQAQITVAPTAAPPELIMALKSGDPAKRREAAAGLGAIRARDTIGDLARALLDKDARVREAAAFALGQITDRNSVPALMGALSDKDTGVRVAAVFALGMIGERKAATALSNALGESSPAVRAAAATALGLMQDEDAVDELIDLLNDASFDVRYDAAWALGQLRDPVAVDYLNSSLVEVETSNIDRSRREAFRQVVQNSIQNLQPWAGLSARRQSESRPRRTSRPAEPTTRPRRRLPYGIVDPEALRGSPNDSPPEIREKRPTPTPRPDAGELVAMNPGVTRPASITRTVEATLTDSARRASITGSVGLRVFVGAEGRAVRAYVTRRLGYGLDQRAVEAVLQYQFAPALREGLPQVVWMDLEVTY